MNQLEGTRVLIVDDDPAQTEVVSEILALEGMRVICASDPEEVDERLSEQPDIVLLDLHGVDAPAVSERLRTLRVRPALLVLSGDLKLADHARALHADGYLAKPYDLDDLLNAVAEVVALRRGKTPDPDPLGAPGMGPG